MSNLAPLHPRYPFPCAIDGQAQAIDIDRRIGRPVPPHGFTRTGRPEALGSFYNQGCRVKPAAFVVRKRAEGRGAGGMQNRVRRAQISQNEPRLGLLTIAKCAERTQPPDPSNTKLDERTQPAAPSNAKPDERTQPAAPSNTKLDERTQPPGLIIAKRAERTQPRDPAIAKRAERTVMPLRGTQPNENSGMRA